MSPCGWLAVILPLASAKDAFLLLGPTGDNALRPSGVWQGLYEAWCGGIFSSAGGVDLYAVMNTPHTKDELREKMRSSLTPLYTKLQGTAGWSCKSPGNDGNCEPDRMVDEVLVNIHEGRDACAQAASMTEDLKGYATLSVYLSIPPYTFGDWANCTVASWGTERVHLAAEKPFGTSLEDADSLHGSIIASGIAESHVHLVDHWLSFFMVKNLPAFQEIVRPRLGISWDKTAFERVVVTQFEERGLEGRGGFFDGVGQVRDMIQSHLLQVLTLALASPEAVKKDRSGAKLSLLEETVLQGASHGQYDGFLLEPKLKFHPGFADATYSDVQFQVASPSVRGGGPWAGVNVSIVTGKDTGVLRYTVEFFQRGGPGVLTYEIGKEETGVAGIRVKDWPLKDDSAFDAPAGGFDSRTSTVRPAVAGGSGYILNYAEAREYFPNPYAVLASALLTRNYGTSFVTYPECRRSWRLLTFPGGSRADTSVALDPLPAAVRVYKQGLQWEGETVEDLYNVTFACTPQHDEEYKDISLYQAKCHPTAVGQELIA